MSGPSKLVQNSGLRHPSSQENSLTTPPFRPEQFTKRPGLAQTETDLRRWLREVPVPERVVFLRALWPMNFAFCLSLAKSSQLPVEQVLELLREWLGSGKVDAAKGLVEAIEPLIGEARFWTAARGARMTPQMRHMLEYQSRGLLGPDGD